MPDVGPKPVSDLGPVAPAAWDLTLVLNKIHAVWWMLLLGVALIVVGWFKPLMIYFAGPFPWIMTGLGLVFCAIALSWAFGLRKAVNSTDQKHWLLTLGVIFAIIMLAVGLSVPNPTEFQYRVFSTLLALAAGGVGAVFPGSFKIKIPKWLHASSSMGLFVLVYRFSPAALFSS
jgi:hypothetical protein